MHRRAPILIAIAALAFAGCSPAAIEPSPTASEPSPTPSFAALASGVYAIECGADHHDPDGLALLSDEAYLVGGWNHVNGVGSFSTVALEPKDYAISANNYQPDATCGGADTLAVVLAKKTYDWDRQHANGIESAFADEELTFADVEAVVLELRFDPERSVLPTAADYEERYGDLLTPEQLAELDGGKVNLEVTLFGNGATPDQPLMNGGVMVELDPVEFADGWVRIKVPREDLAFYTEANYERTPVGSDEFQDLLVQGLRINPETASGNEVRVYVGDDFDPRAKPELFKEMALAFSFIGVERAGSHASD